jgi:toxin ParE1/3/4
MTVVFAQRAIDDMEELHAYIARRSPSSAHSVLARIRRAINRLAPFPHSGRVGRLAGTRELVIAGLPYLAIYEVQDDRVVIQRILHQRQQWPPADDAE